MDDKFILTTKKETADKLIKSGMQILSFGNNQWVFINNEKNKNKFDHLDNIIYTNKLFI